MRYWRALQLHKQPVQASTAQDALLVARRLVKRIELL